ncbi:MAG: heme-binding protein [Actinobacteria bacterium]|nr:heme-binding protein [Actinomycetota bacterium]
MTEHQQYSVVASLPGFELREYPAYSTVSITMKESFDQSGNRAFTPLVRYIGGSNSDGRQIAMTAPVIQEPQSDGEQLVQFVMPAGFTAADMPAPQDARLACQEMPAHLAAAIRYSGLATESAFRKQLARLERALATAGYEAAGPARSARFDPPWKPPFMRHNEVIVPVQPSVVA